MIVQAICKTFVSGPLWNVLLQLLFHVIESALLDDLDKELNNYVMRCREWYGWHFPELGKIVTDHTVYAKTVKALGKLSCTVPAGD